MTSGHPVPTLSAVALAAVTALTSPCLRFTSPAELYGNGRVSPEFSEIRITFNPDGTSVLWGSTNRPGGPGGSGGDDLYAAAVDTATGRYGEARNLGPRVNSAGDEWAPVVSADGATLLFATDGRGGKGLHDLFVSSREKGEWQEPKPLEAVNGPDEDFDGAFLSDGHTLVFTRRRKDQDGADLYVAPWRDGHYATPQRLGPEVNAEKGWNLGPATHPGEPGFLYFSSHRSENTAGRLDIYRVGYRIEVEATK